MKDICENKNITTTNGREIDALIFEVLNSMDEESSCSIDDVIKNDVLLSNSANVETNDELISLINSIEPMEIELTKTTNNKQKKKLNKDEDTQDFVKKIDAITREYISDKRTDFLYDPDDVESLITSNDIQKFIDVLEYINSNCISITNEYKNKFLQEQGRGKAILFNSLIINDIDINTLNNEYNDDNNNYIQGKTKDDLDSHIIIELHQAIQAADPLSFNSLLKYMKDQQEDPLLNNLYTALLNHYTNRVAPSVFSDFQQIKNYCKSIVIKNINNWDTFSADVILVPNCGKRLFIQIEDKKITDFWLKNIGDNKINPSIIQDIQQIFDQNIKQINGQTYIFEIIYNKTKEANVLIIDCCVYEDRQLIGETYSDRYILLRKNFHSNKNLYILEGTFVHSQDIRSNIKKFIENNSNEQSNLFPTKKNYLIKVNQELSNHIKYIELDMSQHYKFLLLGYFEDANNKIKHIVATKVDEISQTLKVIGITNISKQLETKLKQVDTNDESPWNLPEINVHPEGLHIHNEFQTPSRIVTYYDDYIVVNVNNYTKNTKSKLLKMTATSLNVIDSSKPSSIELLFEELSVIDLTKKNKTKPVNKKDNKAVCMVKKVTTKRKKIINNVDKFKLLLKNMSPDEINEIMTFLQSKHIQKNITQEDDDFESLRCDEELDDSSRESNCDEDEE